MRRLTLLTLITVCAVAIAMSCNEKKTEATVVAEISNDSLIKRGEYLITIMGCHDCHTPKKMTDRGPALDESLLLSGHPAQFPMAKFDTATARNYVLMNPMVTSFIGPWGASFAANLTSDPSGIGNWTEDQFKKALKEGKLKGMEGTRPILPPMPWQNFANVQDAEIKAMFAYLKSTKPVNNIVPKPLTPAELAQYAQ